MKRYLLEDLLNDCLIIALPRDYDSITRKMTVCRVVDQVKASKFFKRYKIQYAEDTREITLLKNIVREQEAIIKNRDLQIVRLKELKGDK